MTSKVVRSMTLGLDRKKNDPRQGDDRLIRRKGVAGKVLYIQFSTESLINRGIMFHLHHGPPPNEVFIEVTTAVPYCIGLGTSEEVTFFYWSCMRLN
jgi:hypothetical protein